MSATRTLTLRPKPPKPKVDVVTPADFLRYYDKKGRYILQVRHGDTWKDVPFIGSLSAIPVVTT